MNTELTKFNYALPMPVGSIDAYLNTINRIPFLTAEEEHDLAIRLREENDLDAARELVMSHLRFVARIARGYLGYGLALADLIQEGNIGLMKAVKRFDPYMNVRLVTFAVHWIKAEIHEFILRNWRIVKVATTKAQRKLFFNLRSAKKRLSWLNRAEVEEVAKDLGVKVKDVYEMESRLNAHDLSFDVSSDDEDDDTVFAPTHYLEAHNADPAECFEVKNSAHNQTDNLQNALANLDERSRDIVASRWLADAKPTLHDLADKYKVSAERIRQLEEAALKKLKHSLVIAA